MSVRMRWLAGIAVAGLCIVSGLLGLTAGINLNPAATVRFVPNWGSLADWVAGSGTLAAVVATVYYGWKQRQDLLPRLTVRTNAGVEEKQGMNYPYLFVRLLNSGHTPVEVWGVFVSSDKTAELVELDRFLEAFTDDTKVGFPCVIGPGQEIVAVFGWRALIHIKQFVESSCGSDDNGLYVTARGPIRDFSGSLDKLIMRGPLKPFA